MSGLCKYSHALGTPGQGAHSWRVGGIAAFDVLLTVGLAGVITKFMTSTHTLGMFAKVFAVLIVIAVCIHEAFCVRTRFNAFLFGRPWPDPADVPTVKSVPQARE